MESTGVPAPKVLWDDVQYRTHKAPPPTVADGGVLTVPTMHCQSSLQSRYNQEPAALVRCSASESNQPNREVL